MHRRGARLRRGGAAVLVCFAFLTPARSQERPAMNPCGGLDSIAAANPGKCNWQAFTSDQRSFAAQPGGVCPVGTYRPGQYSLLVGPAGRNGQNVPPVWWNTYGPFTFNKGDKWIAILGAQSRLDRVDKNVGELLQYRDPGSRAGLWARNNDSTEWQAICVVNAAYAGNDGRCRAYADTAVSQQSQNIARGCGFRGDPWHTNHAEHLRWCESVPAERSSSETAMRERELASCGGGSSENLGCDLYATTAVMQQENNLARGCGFSGDPWHTDYAEHLRWCESVPAERSNAEREMRNRELAACTGGSSGGSACGNYARTAVQQQEENLARGCGFSGDPWHTDYDEHFSWCQSVPADRSAAETAMRQNMLAGCR